MTPDIADIWFGIEPQGDNIFRFREVHVDPFLSGDAWLVRGATQNLLVDSCTGIVSIRPLIESLVDGPVVCVAMNRLYDHAGGWHAFDHRACLAGDAASLAEPTAKSSMMDIYVSADMLRALPHPDYRIADYSPRGAEATRLLRDGDAIDLGDRTLEVLHVPGGGFGEMVLWEEATGSLFTSDVIVKRPSRETRTTGVAGALGPASERLLNLSVKNVYGGHYGRFDGALLPDLINKRRAAWQDS